MGRVGTMAEALNRRSRVKVLGSCHRVGVAYLTTLL